VLIGNPAPRMAVLRCHATTTSGEHAPCFFNMTGLCRIACTPKLWRSLCENPEHQLPIAA
jgi:hypothetical protein